MQTVSRPGANAGSWAIRGPIYHDVMDAWSSIMCSAPLRELRWRDQTAWNRLLLDATSKYGWRIKPFESHEIQFPLHLNPNWLEYRDAAILHCVGGNNLVKAEFLFGMYIQKFFYDSKGTVASLFDM